jgi:MFS family permease
MPGIGAGLSINQINPQSAKEWLAHMGAVTVIPKGAYFALTVLALANFLSYLDRQIVSILAQSIKADLHLDDARLGFLLGTAFAVFFSVVGIAMGRISDGLSRKKLMAFGLVTWSVMTALGGTAGSFAMLALARVGVGVGEAVANPCSNSILADMFPPRRRAMALSICLSGVFLGSALALVIGGYLLQNWHHVCVNVPIASACSIVPWKAALFAVALPGLPLALLTLAIREPARATAHTGSATRLIAREFAAALPPFTLATVYRAGGPRALGRNSVLAIAVIAIAAALSHVTGDTAQFSALGLGAYAVITWGQIQSHRDKPLYRLTFGDRTFMLGVGGIALFGCVGGAVNVWAAPFVMRTYAISPRDIGLSLGLVNIAGAAIGVLLGGWLTDRWKLHDRRAPMGVLAISAIGILPCILVMLLVFNFRTFLVATFFLGIFTALPGGANGAMIQDLVLPRMRGAAAASYTLVAIVVSSATGPYWAGKVSAMTGSLTAGLLSVLCLLPFALLLVWLTARRLLHETPASRLALAESAGEQTSH